MNYSAEIKLKWVNDKDYDSVGNFEDVDDIECYACFTE